MNEPDIESTENRISIALRPDLHAKAKTRASGEGKTIKGWLEQAVSFALRNMGIDGKQKAAARK